MTRLCSINVGLELADEAPLREVKLLYGDGEGLLTALKQCLSKWSVALEPPPDDLLPILYHVKNYTALGAVFQKKEEKELLRAMSVTLTDIVQLVVRREASCGGDDDTEVTEGVSLTHQLLTVTSAAISNCCGGTTRHDANMLFWIKLPKKTMRVTFGFADYAEGETGARLWAGAVALAIYLAERLDGILRSVLTHAAGKTARVVELGCGPGLVSLVVASRLTQDQSLACRTLLDVTDISPAVVETVRRSFILHNGPQLAALIADNKRGVVRTFCLDFAFIPSELWGVYDIVLGSDIVYDHAIAAHVAPALAQLLRPGGIAFICCERHRDGMSTFVKTIQKSMAETLEVVENHEDVQTELRNLQMIPGLTATACSLVVLRRLNCDIFDMQSGCSFDKQN